MPGWFLARNLGCLKLTLNCKVLSALSHGFFSTSKTCSRDKPHVRPMQQPLLSDCCVLSGLSSQPHIMHRRIAHNLPAWNNSWLQRSAFETTYSSRLCTPVPSSLLGYAWHETPYIPHLAPTPHPSPPSPTHHPPPFSALTHKGVLRTRSDGRTLPKRRLPGRP